MSGNSLQIADRRRDIVRVVGELLKALDRWNDDRDQSRIDPDSDLATAIDVAVATVGYGAVPHDCRQLAERMGHLEAEFAAYNAREKATRQGEPLPVFWGAMRGVFDTFRVVRLQAENRVFEPVAKLLKDGASEHNVAIHYGGQKKNGVWTGIFFNANGAPRSDLIAQEAEKPGSVVPTDFVHPEDLQRRGELERQYDGHLERLESIENDPKIQRQQRATAERLREIEPAVIKYLTVDKGNPYGATHEFNLTIEQVNDIAKRCGVASDEGSPDFDGDDDEPVEPPKSETPKGPADATPEAVRAAAFAMFDGGNEDNKSVASALSIQFNTTIRAQRIAALRHSWSQQSQAVEASAEAVAEEAAA